MTMLRASIFLSVLATAFGQASIGECGATSEGRSTCLGSDQTTLLQSRVHLDLDAGSGSDEQPQHNSGLGLTQGTIERASRRRRGTAATYRAGLFRENVYYFRQGRRCGNLNGRRAAHSRWKHDVNYRNTGRKWSGFRASNNFAVRWTGLMKIVRSGRYHFQLLSDDGSKMWLDNRYTINNDGLHGWRSRVSRRNVRGGSRRVRIEFFERGGHAGMLFRYHGPDTGNRWGVARANGKSASGRSARSSRRRRGTAATYRAGLFRENVYYFRQGCRCGNLNGRRAAHSRWKHDVNYRNTGRKWSGFRTSNNFAARWTGLMKIFRTGRYHFQLLSDDGSKMWFDNRYTINNDGCHGWRSRVSRRNVRGGSRRVRIEFFERGGHAGMLFRYHGPDTRNRWAVARASGKNAPKKKRAPKKKTPTKAPTKAPTNAPTKAPTQAPTKAPTKAPTMAPTMPPTTAAPTAPPTIAPAKKTSTPCGFEASAQPYCKTWRNVKGDQFDWTRKSGSTPTSRTGPSKAHSGNHYMYIEASWRRGRDKAVLQSSTTTFARGASLSFQHHMFGPRIGTLQILFKEDGRAAQPIVLWQRNGGRGNSWHLANVDLSRLAGKTGVIQFVGIITHRCASFLGDIAIDEVSLTPGAGAAPTKAPTPPTAKPTKAPTPPTAKPKIQPTTMAPTSPPSMAPTTMAPVAPTRSPNSKPSWHVAVKNLTNTFDKMESKVDNILKKVL